VTGRRIRALATVTVVLVSPACGQKAGVGGPDQASAPAAGAPGRAGLIRTVQSGQEFASGIFPPLRYAPGRPYGASQTHLLEADCANRRYRTLATFASSF
jgi:hypothetical protein